MSFCFANLVLRAPYAPSTKAEMRGAAIDVEINARVFDLTTPGGLVSPDYIYGIFSTIFLGAAINMGIPVCRSNDKEESMYIVLVDVSSYFHMVLSVRVLVDLVSIPKADFERNS